MSSSYNELAKSQLFDVTRQLTLSADPACSTAPASDRSQRRQIVIGQVIDQKYKIISLLGEGGMGAVFKAQQLALNRVVALKTFRTATISEEAWGRFQREAQAIGRLNHKNIVRVFDYGADEENVPFYTMECLSGYPLADKITGNDGFVLEELLDIFIQTSQALAVAHNKGIIHRDIKPANIFLAVEVSESKPVVKVVDFGIAGLTDDTIESQKLTATGTVFGSPLYMSPEQALGQTLTPASDIYSFACSLFECIVGEPPYKGENAFATMLMHQTAPIPQLVSANDSEPLPQRLTHLIERMLAKNPGQRPQTFGEVEKELRTVKDKILSRTGTTYSGSSDNQPKHKQNFLTGKMRPALVVGLLVVGFGGLSLCFHPKPEQTRQPSIAAVTVSSSNTSSDDSPSAHTGKPFFVDVEGNFKVYQFSRYNGIGTIHWSGKIPCPDNLRAKGRVSIPLSAGTVEYGPSKDIAADPTLLDGFRDGDFDILTFSSNCQIDDAGLRHIIRFDKLQALNIESFKITDASFDTINSLKKLSYLNVKNTALTSETISKLACLPNLEMLQTSYQMAPTLIIKALGGKAKIESLTILHSNLTNGDLQSISRMTRIHDLNLCGSKAINDNTVSYFEKMPHLRRLNLSLCELSPKSIDQFKTFPQLETLTIGLDEWSTADIEEAQKKLPGVKILSNNSETRIKQPDSDIKEFYLDQTN